MEKHYQLALTLVDGVGSIMFRQLINTMGSAENVFKARTDKLLKTPGVGKQIIDSLKDKTLLTKAENIWKESEKQQVKLCFSIDRDYPSRLKSLYDAPAILYFKGNGDLSALRTVGIVGTRQATEYGRKVTEDIVEQLKPYKVSIISGLAYGIDIIAHKAAIDQGIPTIGVMASGIDVVYPAAHKKYVEQMLDKGGVLSENPFGMKPIRNLFIARNRIIAGISDVNIVVESAEKGGALITADFANNYHHEVFAVPGSLDNKYSAGCHKLIKENKANIFTQTSDIIETMNWSIDGTGITKTTPIEQEIDLTQFTQEEGQVIAYLRIHGETQIDNLSWQTQIPVNRLASLLLNLEFQGIVKAMAGKKFGLKL
ncbi:DNA-processing protein DprA [Emticicia sp. BO119]|uniref:DNA-processing protein DprA n=1 Tax=Emticicia sp. BO119 TaxID=2757768 RepID=UPI0015F0AC5F|nr:DNA-processing protein DprA [Emticicia sp. BO119]MBA4849764.1 DNA-protecting protein DprA [Emticicia sp. BO119]